MLIKAYQYNAQIMYSAFENQNNTIMVVYLIVLLGAFTSPYKNQ